MNNIKFHAEIRNKLFTEAGISPLSKRIETTGPVRHVHYLELGEGRPLILIHGGGSNSGEWMNILKTLSENFHLYVVDRPGCGLTDSIDYTGIDYRESAINFITSFMDAAGLQKTSLLGQSMGGYFSICFAMEHPERVEKLLLIGAPAGMNRWIPVMLRMLGTKGLNRFLVKTVAKASIKNVVMVHKQLLVADVKNLSENYFRYCYYSQLLSGYEKGFLTMLENVLTLKGWRKDLYIGDQLHHLKIPVRFIWGDSDAFEKPETGKPKTSGIVDCMFEVVSNAGHSPWLDQPEKCVSSIISMLRQ